MPGETVPLDLVVGALVTVWGVVTGALVIVYKDMRALQKAVIESEQARTKAAEARLEWYARRDASMPRRPMDSHEWSE